MLVTIQTHVMIFFVTSRMNESTNDSNGVIFSCALGRQSLSGRNITDDLFWTLNEYNILGQPAPDILKLLYCIFLPTVSILLIMRLAKQTKLFNRVYFSVYAFCGISLMLTVFLFGFIPQIVPPGEFFYGSSDTTRCGVCAFAGFLFIFFNTLSLHSYTCWMFLATHFILKNLFPSDRIILRWTFSLLVIAVFVSFWVAIPPIIGFGQYEFD